MKNITSQIKIVFLVSLITSFAWAQRSFVNPGGQSQIDRERQLYGFDAFPILRCPAIPQNAATSINALNRLKDIIKSEANCQPMMQEISKIGDLLGKKREEIVALIEKSRTEQLTDAELAQIKEYAESVTSNVIGTIDRLNNSSCFNEDKEKFDLRQLSQVTLEVVNMLSEFSGTTWGVPLKIGGNVIAGLLKGMDVAMKARLGYDFKDPSQRMNYVSSLCTYYDYRQDIQIEMNPEARYRQLLKLKRNLDLGLNVIMDNCTECTSIQKVFSNTSPMSLAMRKNDRAALAAQSQEIMVTKNVIDAQYVQPLGFYTIRALNTQKWLEGELEKFRLKVERNQYSVADPILNEKVRDFDQFLFQRQGPAFVKWHYEFSRDLLDRFSSYVKGDGSALVYEIGGVLNVASTTKSKETVYRELRSAISSESAILNYLTDHREAFSSLASNGLTDRLRSNLDSFLNRSAELFDHAKVSYNSMSTYCNFFVKSKIYMPDIHRSCSGTVDLRQRFVNLGISEEFSPRGLREFNPTAIYAVDWVDSFNLTIETMIKNPSFYKLR